MHRGCGKFPFGTISNRPTSRTPDHGGWVVMQVGPPIPDFTTQKIAVTLHQTKPVLRQKKSPLQRGQEHCYGEAEVLVEGFRISDNTNLCGEDHIRTQWLAAKSPNGYNGFNWSARLELKKNMSFGILFCSKHTENLKTVLCLRSTQ